MKILLAIALIGLLSGTALALPDTPAERGRQADRYLAATPPKELFRDLAEQMAPNLPPEQREQFKELLTRHLDLKKVTTSIRGALVKIFTADELSALADFYGSAVGQAAMKKMGVYMAEVMPAIQAEMARAFERANSGGPGQTEHKEPAR